MEAAVPYHPGMLLGRSIDMKKIKPGYMLVKEDMNLSKQKIDATSSQFSFATTLKDVCDVLSISPEYALKVKARCVENELVDACLKDLGKTDLLRVIFRITFLEQKQYLPPDFDEQVKNGGKLQTTAADSETSVHDASFLGSLPGKSSGHHGTHWVKAIEIGNELVIVMTVSCQDAGKVRWLGEKLKKYLVDNHGQLDRPKLEALKRIAKKTDKKIAKNENAVCLDIKYCTFTKLDKCPASMTGMVETIERFMDKCFGWTERYKDGLESEVEAYVMRCIPGIGNEESTAVKDSLKHVSDDSIAVGDGQTVAYHPSKKTCEEVTDSNTDDDHDSFVVLDSGSCHVYNLRVILQSFKGDNKVAERPNSLTTITCEKLLQQLVNCEDAPLLLQDFLDNKRFPLETHLEEGNEVLKDIKAVRLFVLETVANLDFVCIPAENTLENVITTNPVATVSNFIENVTYKLPPGSDIDLLMIGKTGHGKSSTGNSILGCDKFVVSSYGDSLTKHSGVKWVEIDGRIIKVVDTPGMCDTMDGNASSNDTKQDGNASSNDFAIKSLSKAIALCPEGFHALLLIIRFPTRMTKEEKLAIHLLKSVLGKDILKSHCICVFTYGDSFEAQNEKISFEKWCKKQSGFFKELFEECNYRCVLINNLATDERAKKTQLIKLVSKVDSLNGIRYTSSLFELARKERERIIAEEKVPQMNEDVIRDVQLILNNLNNLVDSTKETLQAKTELSKLTERVDNLYERLQESEVSSLLTAVIAALSATLHAKTNETVGGFNANSSEVSGGSTTPKEELGKLRDDIKTENKRIEDYQLVITQNMPAVEDEVKKKECFPGSSVVMLSNGKCATLEELCVGDKVLVRDNTGHLSFDTVYMFGHQELDASSEFLALKTASHTVYVTAGHYVYCVRNGTELCVAAENVHVGDCLLVASGDSLVLQSVEAVTYERKPGLFAPFTNSGNIIIDGVLMSCYIDVLPATMCHTLLWPVRQLYNVSPHMLSFINGSPSQHPVPRLAKAALKLM